MARLLSRAPCTLAAAWLCWGALTAQPALAQGAAREPGGLPTREQLQRAEADARAAIGAGVRVPQSALDTHRAAGALDLSDLAQQYERMRVGPGQADPGREQAADREARGLMVFVSLNLPQPSLERLIADAQRLHAPLVLRGVTSSIRQTVQRIEQLNAGRPVAWQIDPALFKRFDVRAVPTFVLVDPARPLRVDCAGPASPASAGAAPGGFTGGSTCPPARDAAEAFSKVAGDVSFGHALAEIDRADPAFSTLAHRYAARLQAHRQGARQ